MLFKKIIWNGKNPKFRKEIMESPIEKGGLGLTDLKTFDKSLKLSWLKRIQFQNEGWAEFPHIYNIQKIVLFGDNYAESLSKNVKNKFWADVAKGAFDLLRKSKPNNTIELHNAPIWYNSSLSFQFRKEWASKGYFLIKDILDEEGALLTLNDLQTRELKINFLDYITLKLNFQKMKGTFKNVEKKFGPDIPTILSKIGIASKGCANTYKTLSSTNSCIIGDIQTKWSEVLNIEILPEYIDRALKNMRKTPINAYTKYILFQLLHSRIVTNKKNW